MDLFWIFLIFVVGIIIFFAWAQFSLLADKKKSMEKKLSLIPDFSPTQKFMGEDGNGGVAIDEERKKLVLIKYEKRESTFREVSYRELLSSELFVDGATVTKTERLSQIGGALTGGLFFGGVGAVIGGLSGAKRSSSEEVKRIDLRLTIYDTKNPLHDVNFMSTEVKKNGVISGFIYNDAMNKARHWHGMIDVLIKTADKEDSLQENFSSTKNIDKSHQSSVADELLKLNELKEKGVISEDEFILQKNKILS